MLRNKALSVLCPLLAMLAAPAFALDIDRIEVKSRYGQPLLAEIPVIADNPTELQHLQAQLASPATFARIGLERPRGVLKDLRFRLARDARGKPVIRVTSSLPVEQPFLTFLIQVEWGDGRLVREYSVSLDAPGTLAAPALPLIEAPLVAPSNAIARNPGPVPAPLAIPLAAPVPVPPAAPAQPAPPAQAAAPVEVATRAVPVQREASAAAPATPAPASTVRKPAVPPAKQPAAAVPPAAARKKTGAYGPVRAGDTLSEIADRFVDPEHSLNQVMLAFLRANPEAFVAGNINLIRRGVVLQAPSSVELSRYSAAQAAVMVRDQIDHWREGILATPQPAALAIAPAPVPEAKAVTARDNGPRLEISPPSSDAGVQQAIQTGLQSTGSGNALRQDSLPPAQETDASHDAQLRELQARVAELEQLQQQQQQLIALKDSELAARPAGHAASWPWWLAALVVLPLSTWWWTRRRERARSSRAQPEDTPGPSASFGDDAGLPATPETLHAQSPAWHSGARGQTQEPDR